MFIIMPLNKHSDNIIFSLVPLPHFFWVADGKSDSLLSLFFSRFGLKAIFAFFLSHFFSQRELNGNLTICLPKAIHTSVPAVAAIRERCVYGDVGRSAVLLKNHVLLFCEENRLLHQRNNRKQK